MDDENVSPSKRLKIQTPSPKEEDLPGLSREEQNLPGPSHEVQSLPGPSHEERKKPVIDRSELIRTRQNLNLMNRVEITEGSGEQESSLAHFREPVSSASPSHARRNSSLERGSSVDSVEFGDKCKVVSSESSMDVDTPSDVSPKSEEEHLNLVQRFIGDAFRPAEPYDGRILPSPDEAPLLVGIDQPVAAGVAGAGEQLADEESAYENVGENMSSDVVMSSYNESVADAQQEMNQTPDEVFVSESNKKFLMKYKKLFRPHSASGADGYLCKKCGKWAFENSVVNCGHHFCSKCVDKPGSHYCPVCKMPTNTMEHDSNFESSLHRQRCYCPICDSVVKLYEMKDHIDDEHSNETLESSDSD